ncbi:pseudouridine synthase [Eremomyces bilateralis CBS 781.70]|uniref:tRNA pseudouridine synthase 1 n=1 Tax=Eremomyces bilateralis CBS 781.70 TaxID=1392243 RepID=A0A6G1G403_9PEZI|nr:pseudouridine synthase [Eremomyces bilateralis CBS 781.70]KAF1812636.1 pseudouridine synthase [Eremomyces bilateralis CBS 781.70]
MQIMPNERTIEGDLFSAFVSAGAISKANANDPKKSTLVRCARTDKGVHAAGNVVSLKLIVEDEDIVEKINTHLPPQIRVWGFLRTIGSFSCYAACDSRWYEYLIPTHCFLPPNPASFLGKKIVELAKEADDVEGYQSRQGAEKDFWKFAEEKHVAPILARLDDNLRSLINKALYEEENVGEFEAFEAIQKKEAKMEEEALNKAGTSGQEQSAPDQPTNDEATEPRKPSTIKIAGTSIKTVDLSGEQQASLDQAIKDIKEAHYHAKAEYRITPERLERVKLAFSQYKGTSNYHNYTVRKMATDPSAKRHMKSFEVNGDPMILSGTEWISLKVHGQSFMMHQIRKMVSMAALIVRCGTPVVRIPESFEHTTIAIPKAPGLGLLLERPIFDTYNKIQAEKFDKEPIDFSKYDAQIQEFKQREIYNRIFEEDAKDHTFYNFFSHVDGYKESSFLYLSSKGFDAVKAARVAPGRKSVEKALVEASDSEEERMARGGEEG